MCLSFPGKLLFAIGLSNERCTGSQKAVAGCRTANSGSNFHLRIELAPLAYRFNYTRLPARQIAPVTVLTNNTNAIPVGSFVH
jgi:hypothetical protein